MNKNLENSIWPNTDGNLGNIKVEIPDGVTTKWPEGDALVDNFVYQEGKLVGFVDTKALINNSSKSSNIPYDYVKIHLENVSEGEIVFNLAPNTENFIVTYGSTFTEEVFKYKGCTTADEVIAVDPDYLTNDIVDGVWTQSLADLQYAAQSTGCSYGLFQYCASLTTFRGNLSSLRDGNGMFSGCHQLTSFNTDLISLEYGGSMFSSCSTLTTFSSDLRSLTNGNGMFDSCSKLTTFSSDLSSLTNGNGMFSSCYDLKSFDSDLSSLTNGERMFASCWDLKSFNSDLSSLTKGYNMFHDCTTLTSFSSDLSNLTNGNYMFNNCYNLTTFSSDLSSLMDGSYMFRYCKLDTASVQNIADTINVPTSKRTIHIGIGNSTPNEQEETAFNTIASRNWKVYVNGIQDSNIWNPTATTPIDGEQTTTPIPFWAKPVPSDEQDAQYVDYEGNYYNILGGNFIYGDDLSTYGMFVSEEDAAANMRLKRIGEEEIETA